MTETHNVDELRQACYAIIRALAEIVDHLDTQEATLDHTAIDAMLRQVKRIDYPLLGYIEQNR